MSGQQPSGARARRVRVAAAALLLAISLPVAAELSDDLSLGVELGYSTATASDARNVGGDATIDLGIDRDLGDTLSMTLSGRLRGEQFDRLRPGNVDFASYDGASRPAQLGSHGSAELRDAYLDVRLSNGLIRLGKQQIVWGALDGIKVLDAVNPASFERFILDDFDDARIGLWSALLDLSIGEWRGELALIPDATTHDVPAAGSWFEPIAPRYRFGSPSDAPALPQRALGSIEQEGSAALRLSRYIRGIDLQFVALSGVDFEPLGRVVVESGDPLLETYHRRRSLFGLSATGSVGPFVLRTEVAYQPNRHLPTRDAQGLDEVTANQWRGAIAADFNAPLDVFLNVQLLVDHIEDAPQALVRPQTDRLLTITARRSFRYDAIVADLRLYRSLSDDDELLRAKLRWSLGDRLALSLSAERFSGTSEGIFGQFADRDLVRFGVEVQI